MCKQLVPASSSRAPRSAPVWPPRSPRPLAFSLRCVSRAHLLRGSVSACARQSCVRDHSPSVPCSRFDASSVTTRVYVFLGRPKYPRKHVESRRMPARESDTASARRKLVIHFLVKCSRIACCVSVDKRAVVITVVKLAGLLTRPSA